MTHLETLPFAGLLAALGAIGGMSGVLLLGGTWQNAVFMMTICACGGYFGGVNSLRKRGLPKNASMADYMAKDG